MNATLAQPTDSEPVTLIDRLLAEQRSLTAVDLFAKRHESLTEPLHAPYYRDLIPLAKPAPGEQYAFEVNLDKCTGCKACVSACHSLNGLEENETWRDVGLLLGNFDDGGYQQTVTTACHHCDDPACANGCPVLAYEKDPETGIVRHLDDQCIGCQYCALKCPYEVPKYSKSLGIVRKCDMCHSRLAVGEAPACVQACPTSAIRIVTATKSEILARTRTDGARLLPTTVASAYTRPSTQYVTERPVPPDTRPADARQPRLEHSHLPLVNMLTFTQIGVGLLTGYAILSFLSGSAALGVGIAGTGVLLLGLGASVLHLGQPLKAWRVFLGLRKSWLSREVVTFGGVPPLALGALLFPQFLAIPAVLAGLAGVFTSVMVYADTQRVLWRFPRTALRFFGTTALFAAGGLSFGDNAVRWPALAALIAVFAIKLAWEILFLRHAHADDDAPDTLSARILTGDAGGMRRKGIARFTLAGLGLVMVFTGFVPVMVVGLACLAAGEWIERYQFFRSVVAHRMPGGM